MTSALVVDDHPFIREAVKALLKKEGINILSEAENGAEAIHRLKDGTPDIVILDISMSKLDGLQVLERIASLKLRTKIVVLTSYSADLYAHRCMQAGASGYVSKTDNIFELSQAITAVLSGYTYFPDLNRSSVRGNDYSNNELDLVRTLSNRELIVLQLLARGMSNKEISDQMLLSNKTISTYKVRIINKLGIESVVNLSEFAKRNGII